MNRNDMARMLRNAAECIDLMDELVDHEVFDETISGLSRLIIDLEEPPAPGSPASPARLAERKFAFRLATLIHDMIPED